MSRPFFSILLPTKNRSEILGGAIESALNQSFGDFELIISDNDDSQSATSEVVSRYPDKRIRYFRTSGNLAMHENWDNAFCQATGEHVLILEDKVRLVLNALEILHHHIRQFGEVVISYDLKFAKTERIPNPTKIPPARFYQSEEVIEIFCRFEQAFFNLLPKGLDSCAPRSLLEKIKQKSPTGYLFSHISPDYASAFMLLSEIRGFYFIKQPLVYIPNDWMWKGKYSNGQSNYLKDSQIKRFMHQLPVKTEQILERVPIKTQWLWINSVLYDFFTKYTRPDHRPEIDWVRYFGFCIILVLMGKKVGGDLTIETQEIKRALLQESRAFQIKVGVNVAQRCFGWGWRLAKNLVGRT